MNFKKKKIDFFLIFKNGFIDFIMYKCFLFLCVCIFDLNYLEFERLNKNDYLC